MIPDLKVYLFWIGHTGIILLFCEDMLHVSMFYIGHVYTHCLKKHKYLFRMRNVNNVVALHNWMFNKCNRESCVVFLYNLDIRMNCSTTLVKLYLELHMYDTIPFRLTLWSYTLL